MTIREKPSANQWHSEKSFIARWGTIHAPVASRNRRSA